MRQMWGHVEIERQDNMENILYNQQYSKFIYLFTLIISSFEHTRAPANKDEAIAFLCAGRLVGVKKTRQIKNIRARLIPSEAKGSRIFRSEDSSRAATQSLRPPA
jgi:hypothetical protein